MQRKPIKPVVLYAQDVGWAFRYKKLTVNENKLVQGERCEVQVLEKLFGFVEQRQDWILEGQYGTTELIFYRTDEKMRSFVLDRDNTSSALENIKDQLPVNSVVLEYQRMINKSFPPAEDVTYRRPRMNDGTNHP
ncbi:MAG: hypothetical protein ABSD57_12690 [Verrucomicrobiota bacterium]|jgi:hypothetical protein